MTISSYPDNKCFKPHIDTEVLVVQNLFVSWSKEGTPLYCLFILDHDSENVKYTVLRLLERSAARCCYNDGFPQFHLQSHSQRDYACSFSMSQISHFHVNNGKCTFWCTSLKSYCSSLLMVWFHSGRNCFWNYIQGYRYIISEDSLCSVVYASWTFMGFFFFFFTIWYNPASFCAVCTEITASGQKVC